MRDAVQRTIAVLGVGLMLTACNGTTDPGSAPTLTQARAARGASTTPQVLRFLPGSPPLQTYDTAATVVVGRHGWLEIFHEDLNWFLTLDIPPSARFVYADGTPVPLGQPIGVRAQVDSTFVSFEFEPHGSYFIGPRPVELWVGLKYVDLGGKDRLPAIWYQADGNEPWTPLPTDVRVAGRWLVVTLRHFSNYAVAW